MTDLPKDLRALVEAARSGHDPDDTTKARVRASLTATLATGASIAPVVSALSSSSSQTVTSAVPTTLAAKLASLQVWLWTGASLVVAGSGLWAASVLVDSAKSRREDVATVPVAQHSQRDVAEQAQIDVAQIAHRASQSATKTTNAIAAGEPTAPKLNDLIESHEELSEAQDIQSVQGSANSDTSLRGSSELSTPRAMDTTHELGGPRSSTAVSPATTTQNRGVSASAATQASSSMLHAGVSTELELVRRATAAVGAGHYRAALAALAEHQGRFPQGALLEERLGLQAVSMCKLGQSGGRAHAAQFVGAYPASPLVERVRAACESGR